MAKLEDTTRLSTRHPPSSPSHRIFPRRKLLRRFLKSATRRCGRPPRQGGLPVRCSRSPPTRSPSSPSPTPNTNERAGMSGRRGGEGGPRDPPPGAQRDGPGSHGGPHHGLLPTLPCHTLTHLMTPSLAGPFDAQSASPSRRGRTGDPACDIRRVLGSESMLRCAVLKPCDLTD